MNPEDFKGCRLSLGMSQVDFALALGYQSQIRENLRQQIEDLETGQKPISPAVGRLAWMFYAYGVPERFGLRWP